MNAVSRLSRHPVLLGFAAGWVVGVIWWSGLMIAFGPSTRVTHVDGQWHEEPITVASRLLYGPLMAIPWGVVGLIVGAVNMWLQGYSLPVMATIGTVAGGVFSLSTRPFDGWLALTMPFDCFVGTLIGSVLGIAIASGSIEKGQSRTNG